MKNPEENIIIPVLFYMDNNERIIKFDIEEMRNNFEDQIKKLEREE